MSSKTRLSNETGFGKSLCRLGRSRNIRSGQAKCAVAGQRGRRVVGARTITYHPQWGGVSSQPCAGRVYGPKDQHSLYPYSIGSCTIGWVPYPAAVYTLVLGHITEDEKRKVGSCMQAPSLQEVANLCLSKHLPEYMLPHA